MVPIALHETVCIKNGRKEKKKWEIMICMKGCMSLHGKMEKKGNNDEYV